MGGEEGVFSYISKILKNMVNFWEEKNPSLPMVKRIQKEASSKDFNVEKVSKETLIVAKKLDFTDLEEYIMNEFNGYKKKEEIPEYRKLCVELMNYHYSCNRDESKLVGNIGEEYISTKNDSINDNIYLNYSISKLKEMYDDESKYLYIEIWFNQEDKIFEIHKSDIKEILDKFLNNIIIVMCGLEKNGILGKNDSFTKKEISKTKDFELVFDNGYLKMNKKKQTE